MGLILARYPGETIEIGEGIAAVVVSVQAIQGRRVRLRIEAPANVKIHRGEVAARKRKEAHQQARSRT